MDFQTLKHKFSKIKVIFQTIKNIINLNLEENNYPYLKIGDSIKNLKPVKSNHNAQDYLIKFLH